MIKRVYWLPNRFACFQAIIITIIPLSLLHYLRQWKSTGKTRIAGGWRNPIRRNKQSATIVRKKTNKDLFVCKYSIQFCAKVLFRSFRWFVCRQVLFVFYVNKLPFSFQMEILNKYVFVATCFVLYAHSLKMLFLFNYHNVWEKFTAEIQFPLW